MTDVLESYRDNGFGDSELALDASKTELPCQMVDADLWFSENPGQLEEAKALCGDCPLRRECLAEALDREEPWGVWGGEIFDQGVVIARKRPRGRPRKTQTAA
jgi:WhiB family transcriptional regulator, redox-sensing transcriptional regulator